MLRQSAFNLLGLAGILIKSAQAFIREKIASTDALSINDLTSNYQSRICKLTHYDFNIASLANY